MMHTIVESPIGELTLVGDDAGAALTAIYMAEHRHAPAPEQRGSRVEAEGEPAIFRAARTQFGEYFGQLRSDFELPVAAAGTAFQRAVWAELSRIPYGETRSYGEIAARIGNPKAVRAVGLAIGRNPLSIVVPCHRVVGAKGALTGFGGGLERKEFLLGLERSRRG